MTSWHGGIGSVVSRCTLLSLRAGNPPVTGGFLVQNAYKSEIWWFLCGEPELATEQTINTPVKWYASTSMRTQPNEMTWTQIARFMGPTWGPSGSCQPQMGPMLAPWTLLSMELLCTGVIRGPSIRSSSQGLILSTWHNFNPSIDI